MPYMTENVIVSNSYDPKGQNENSDKHELMIKYQLSTPDNVDVVQMINFTVKKSKTSIFDPHLTHWDKLKILKPYCTSTRHISFHILEYNFSSPEYKKSFSDNFTKTVIFGP